MEVDLNKMVRNNIKKLHPYSSARHEYTGKATLFLDANENAFGSPLPGNFNRYPDPLQWEMKFQLAKIKGVPTENIFIGNGSDEVIDLAYRIFCNPGKDNVIICPPTYGMYEVCGHINDIETRKINLTQEFQLDIERIMNTVTTGTKLLFICSPNNPTGNNMNRNDIELLLNNFPGIILIDEAYINYSRQRSFITELTEYPNLVVMQTLSKAWGMAGLRLGLCYGSLNIIDLFNKIKPPYNINEASQQFAVKALQKTSEINAWIKETISQREFLEKELGHFSFILKIYRSDANFILVKVNDATHLYQFLSGHGIIVRNRSNEILCDNCLRITVGTGEENAILLKTLNLYGQ